MSVAASAAALQSPTPADCRHSRAGFHCTFTSIASRRHLSSDAKLLHAALVSMVRRRLEWTQAEIAAELGWESRQRVWRASAELVADDLLTIRRRGLGRPNEYILKPTDDITVEDLAARAKPDRGFRSGHQEVRTPNAPARANNYPKKTAKNGSGYTPPTDPSDYTQTREGTYTLIDGRMVLVPHT